MQLQLEHLFFYSKWYSFPTKIQYSNRKSENKFNNNNNYGKNNNHLIEPKTHKKNLRRRIMSIFFSLIPSAMSKSFPFSFIRNLNKICTCSKKFPGSSAIPVKFWLIRTLINQLVDWRVATATNVDDFRQINQLPSAWPQARNRASNCLLQPKNQWNEQSHSEVPWQEEELSPLTIQEFYRKKCLQKLQNTCTASFSPHKKWFLRNPNRIKHSQWDSTRKMKGRREGKKRRG